MYAEATLVIVALATPALSQSLGDAKAKPQATRYWLDPEYQRSLVEYEKRRDALEVFWHLSSPVEVLERIATSLKPGAKLVLVEKEDGKSVHGDRVVEHTRENMLSVVSRTRFRVERIDTSLPAPAWVVVVLALK